MPPRLESQRPIPYALLQVRLGEIKMSLTPRQPKVVGGTMIRALLYLLATAARLPVLLFGSVAAAMLAVGQPMMRCYFRADRWLARFTQRPPP